MDDHHFAKWWSSMKGNALSLQFNPDAQLSDEDFRRLHELMGTAPVLPNALPEAYLNAQCALLEARRILTARFPFVGLNPAGLRPTKGKRAVSMRRASSRAHWAFR